MLKTLLIFLTLYIFSCNYPDIDDIPYYSDLNIDYKDKKIIRNLTKERNEIIPTEAEIASFSSEKSIKAHKQYGLLKILGMKYK